MAAASPAPSALRRVAAGPWALLTSLLLLMVGAGLEGSLLGLRAEAAGFDVTVTGAILGGYYLGYVAGSVIVTRGIAEVGHIRVYSGLAAIASVVILVHGVWVAPGPWLALRFLSGMCLAVIRYAREGHVDFRVAITIAVCLALAAPLGAHFGISLGNKGVTRAFGLFLVVLGVRFIARP